MVICYFSNQPSPLNKCKLIQYRWPDRRNWALTLPGGHSRTSFDIIPTDFVQTSHNSTHCLYIHVIWNQNPINCVIHRKYLYTENIFQDNNLFSRILKIFLILHDLRVVSKSQVQIVPLHKTCANQVNQPTFQEAAWPS